MNWSKSSYCGGGECVEITALEPTWTKSSVCDSSACVEIAEQDKVRYMRDAQGTIMALDLDALRDLVSDVKAGTWDQYV